MKILFNLSLVVFLCGCTAGKEVMVRPQDEFTRQNCGEHEIYPGSLFSDGFMVLYYVIPLLPVPNNSKTKSSLEIPIHIINRVSPIQDLTIEDVAVRVPSLKPLVRPHSIDQYGEVSLPDKPYYHKTFKFTFDTNRHELQKFELVFSKELYECTIPDVPYIKAERFRLG